MAVRFELDRTPLSAEATEETLAIGRLVFGLLDEKDVIWRMQNMPDLSVFSARLGSELVGFKIGYAVTSKRYYSWLGGVTPAHRRLGIAETLMTRQHEWVFGRGYDVIETEVLQDNRVMQMLNERSGFQAAGVRFDGDPARVIYRRRGEH